MDKETKTTGSAAPLKQATPNKKLQLSRTGFAILVALLGGLAGFGGAAAYMNSGLAETTDIVTRDKVVMQEGEVVADVAKNVSQSVVSIITETSSQTIFGYNALQQGAGTGIIISKDGYVVTNKHVASRNSRSVQIVGADGTQYKSVRFVGSDPTNDITFLKIEGADNLKPAVLGDSSHMRVGQKVVAIGNALGEYQNTVTTGIISALSRPVTAADGAGSAETLENLLQTDAAINPGNSGGPLVNLAGEIIGINTAVASNAEGIGFAIPINDVKGMVDTLLATGKVVKPYIGVRYVPITAAVAKELNLSVTQGALLFGQNGAAIAPGGPAEKAGLQENDIITKINDTPIDSTHPFASVVAQQKPGANVTITYVRGGETRTVTLEVAGQ